MPVADFQDVQTIGIGVVAAIFIALMAVSAIAIVIRHNREKRARELQAGPRGLSRNSLTPARASYNSILATV